MTEVKINGSQLFYRLKFQALFRSVERDLGFDAALAIVQKALEVEFRRDRQLLEEHERDH